MLSMASALEEAKKTRCGVFLEVVTTSTEMNRITERLTGSQRGVDWLQRKAIKGVTLDSGREIPRDPWEPIYWQGVARRRKRLEHTKPGSIGVGSMDSRKLALAAVTE